MKMICKATLHFVNRDNPAETFRSTPNTLPVDVPDWVRSSEMFELAVKDGTIIVPEGHFFADGAKPTAAQLALVSDEDLVAEQMRRRDAAAESAKAAEAGAGKTPQVDKGSKAPDGTIAPKAGASGVSAAKTAEAGKEANEDAAAAAAAGKGGLGAGAPGPTPGTTQTSVPANKSGDGATGRA